MSLHAELALERPAFTLDLMLDASDGQKIGQLVPKGSGKSTTQRCLAGLEQPQRGVVEITGTTVTDTARGIDVPPERRSVGYVFQDYLLFPHMSVLDNVSFGLRARGAGRKEADTAARAWLERLDIADLATRRPGQLSGGQAQRVALARALVTDPDLLLLDEPLAALDAGTRASVRSLLRRHLADFRGAVVLVTHDPMDAMVLADRVVVLEEGRVVQTGTPGEIARRPASDYVAQLVGVNMLRGHAADGTVSLAGGGEIRIADQAIVGTVIVALRPEAISVHLHHPEGSARNVWQASVTALESRGDLVRVELDGPPTVTAVITPGAVADLGLHEGARVWLSAKATELDVYPA
mgnify:FL=1